MMEHVPGGRYETFQCSKQSHASGQ
jgi:hypothetical protein